MPDSNGSFLLRPHALLPSTLESSNMKAHRPRTPKRKTANAQLWDSVETAASGMPALLGERLLFMRGALPRRMRLLYACRAGYERGGNFVSAFRHFSPDLRLNSAKRSAVPWWRFLQWSRRMTIFEALRASHDRQRQYVDAVLVTKGDTPERKSAYKQLKEELYAHETAEERFFYIPLMAHENGV